MHPYRSLETAAIAILRHHPSWLDDLPTPAGGWPDTPDGMLISVGRLVNGQNSDTTVSDEVVPHLAALARTDTDVMTVLLAAMSRRLRRRFQAGATSEYLCDGLSNLAISQSSPTFRSPVSLVVCSTERTRSW